MTGTLADSNPDAFRHGKLLELREPFPPTVVGKLPKISCKACSDSRTKNCDKHMKAECGECGNWITTRHVHLDYVGHAALTKRLLQCDPLWTWEPLAFTAEGLPAIKDGNLWIRLTVCGVTRLGVGDGKNPKEMIGDALRNAAMRFGAALDLWAKEDLSALGDAAEADPEPSKATFKPEPVPEHLEAASPEQRHLVLNAIEALKGDAADDLKDWWRANCRSVMHTLTAEDARKVLDHLTPGHSQEPIE